MKLFNFNDKELVKDVEGGLQTKGEKAAAWVKDHKIDIAVCATAVALGVATACVWKRTSDIVNTPRFDTDSLDKALSLANNTLANEQKSGRYPFGDFQEELNKNGYVTEFGNKGEFFDYQKDPASGFISTFILEKPIVSGQTVMDAKLTPEILQSILDNISDHYVNDVGFDTDIEITNF